MLGHVVVTSRQASADDHAGHSVTSDHGRIWLARVIKPAALQQLFRGSPRSLKCGRHTLLAQTCVRSRSFVSESTAVASLGSKWRGSSPRYRRKVTFSQQ